MVKVIGRDDKAVKRCTCPDCASRLEYTKSETQTATYYDYGGGSEEWRYIICPTCGKKVEVKY